MNQGIKFDVDWKLTGAALANASDTDQVDFFKAFVKECLGWGTQYQAELQLASVNSKLTSEEKSLLGMIGHDGE